MGSFSQSNTQSKTNYSNLPITLADNASAVTGAGSDGSQIGGYGNVNGAINNSTNLSLARGGSLNMTTTTLDGGAISKAFDFGSNLVGIVADLTKQSNAAAQSQSGQALQAVATMGTALQDETKNAGDWMQNKTLIYAAAAVAVAYFVFLRK